MLGLLIDAAVTGLDRNPLLPSSRTLAATTPILSLTAHHHPHHHHHHHHIHQTNKTALRSELKALEDDLKLVAKGKPTKDGKRPSEEQ